MWRFFYEKTPIMDLSMKTTLSHSNQPTIESLQAQVEELTAKVKWYEDQFRLSQQTRFGTSSEKTPNNQLALELFNGAEKESDSETSEPVVETITYRRKKKRGQGFFMPHAMFKTKGENECRSCCILHSSDLDVEKLN